MSHNFSNSRRTFMLASAAMFLPASLNAAKTNYGIVGQLAPELKISQWIDGEGKPSHFRLADHLGKFVFLELWQAWCPGCHSHGFPTLQQIHAEFSQSEYFMSVAIQTTFEGYATNTADKMRIMQKRYSLPITMGHDAGDSLRHEQPNTMKSYRTGGTPWAILIAPDGTVIFNDFSIDGEAVIAYLRNEIAALQGLDKRRNNLFLSTRNKKRQGRSTLPFSIRPPRLC